MRRISLLVLLFLSTLVETGCFSRRFFQPPAPPEITSKPANPLLAPGWLDRYHKVLNEGNCADNSKPVNNATCPNNVAYTDYIRAYRNQYLNAIQAKIDENYDNFKSSVYAGNAVFSASSDFAAIGLNGAGAVVGDAGLKAILSVAAGGVTGASSSYQKEILNQQNSLAIVSAMDAARAEQAKNLTASETLDVSKYPLETGLVDLRQYYAEGTMVNGLLYIQGKAQQLKQQAQGAAQGIKTPTLTPPQTAAPASATSNQ